MGTFLCEALKVFLLLQPWPYSPVEEEHSLSPSTPFFFFLNELETVWEALPFMRRKT